MSKMFHSPIMLKLWMAFVILPWVAYPVSAQSPHVGTYTGHLTIELSGAFNSGPTASGKMIFNVFPDGTVAEIGGDPVGTVNEAGAITWEQPNTFNFTTGTIADGTLASESSTTENSLTRTLRIEAKILGGAFPQGQTFTNQLVDLTPENGYRDHRQVIAANGGFIAIGQRGTVALSDDGLTWRRSAAPTARDLNAVAFGNGTYLIGGDHGVLMTSTDGVNWVPRNTPFQFNLGITGVAFGEGKFVISSQFSNIATSVDGVVWDVQPTALASFLPGNLRHLDGQFVYWSGDNVRFSADGETWSAPANIGVSAISDISHGGGYWVAGGWNGVAVSPDGAAWTTVFPGVQVRTVGAGQGRFVANLVGSLGGIYYSTGPGATAWRQANGPAGGQSVVFNGSRFVMAGPQLAASDDGISWRTLRSDPRTIGALPQQVFTNSDGTRVVMNVTRTSPEMPAPFTSFWVGPNGAAYLNDAYLKTPFDPLTTGDLHAIAGEYIGGEGGVIRRVTMTGGVSDRGYVVTPVASPTTNTLRSGISYGGQFMVGDNGTILRMSGDEAVPEASGTTANLRFVDVMIVSSASLPYRWIAVGDNGTLVVRREKDGQPGVFEWVARDTGTTANLIGVGYLTHAGFQASANSRYVAIGEDGTVISSTDTITWVEENPVIAPGKLDYFKRIQGQFSYDGTLMGDGFAATVHARPEGIVVTGGSTTAGSFTASRIVHGGDRFVAVVGNRAHVSLDGRDWQSTLVPGNFRDVAYGAGVFVAVGGNSSNAPEPDRVYYSYDGLTWHRANQPSFNRLFEAVSHHNGRFIAIGTRGYIAGSTNGIDWDEISPDVSATERFVASMASGGGKFVGVGSDFGGNRSFVISSVDGGDTWAVRQDSTGGRYVDVTYGNGMFVLVGGNRIRRSTDGISFTAGVNISHNASSTGSTPEFTHVFFANGVFVATTASGQAYVSSDAITWEERFTGVRGGFTGSAVANGQVLLSTNQKVIALAIEDEGSPYVVQQPQNTSLVQGATLNLSATATGAAPVTYQWTRNGAPLVDDDEPAPTGFTTLSSGGRISGATTLNLRIENMDAGDAGEYRLVVTNALGGRSSRAAVVTVMTPPVIVEHPVGITASPNTEVILLVTAEGGGLSYQWFKNDVLLPGKTGATLVIDSITVGDAGLYTAEVTNLAGTASSFAAPVSISSPPGGSLTLALNSAFNANVPELRNTNVVLQFGTFPAFALRQLLVQPDGKVLVAGQFEYTGNGGQARHSLMRLNPDGTLDSAFNVPTLEIDGHNNVKYAASIEQVALLSDGRIVLTGGSIQRIGGVLRTAIKSAMLNADGTHVTTFSPGMASNANPYSVAVDSSNRILYAGNNITSNRHIRRFQTSGSLDTGFVGSNLGHTQAMNQSLVIQPDDKPVYSAYTTDFTGIRTHRTTTGGAIDGTFQSADFEGGNLWVNSHTPLAGGEFLVNGRFTSVNGTPRSGIARFAADGALDPTFAPQGELTGSAQVYSSALLPGGFVFAGGDFTTPAASNLAVFGVDGSIQDVPALGSGTDIFVNSVAANADGTIAYAGGNFFAFDGQPTSKVIRFDATAVPPGDPVDLQIIAASTGRAFVDGEKIVLSVAATGGSLTFQWFKNDSPLGGETGMSLALSNMTEENAGVYRVEVSDHTGMVPSADIVLTFGAGPVDPFADWIAGFELPADRRGPFDDANGNGRANIVEFLLGNHPGSTAMAPVFTVEPEEGGAVTFFFRTAKAAAGIPFAVQATQDLGNFDSGLGAAILSDGGDDDYHYWKTTVAPADPAKGVFVRLLIQLP